MIKFIDKEINLNDFINILLKIAQAQGTDMLIKIVDAKNYKHNVQFLEKRNDVLVIGFN